MKPKEIIRLRGHHLRILRLYYYANSKIVKKRLQVANPPIKYGKKNAAKVIEILKKARKPANSRFFIITDRIDDICRACKKRRYWECCRSGRIKTSNGTEFFFTAAKEDRKMAKNFGLKIGKIYPSKEISEALRY